MQLIDSSCTVVCNNDHQTAVVREAKLKLRAIAKALLK